MSRRTKKTASALTEDEVPNGITWTARRVMMIASAVGLIATALVGVNTASPIIEPYWPATHAFVLEKANDLKAAFTQEQFQTNIILRSMQIEATEGKIEATKDAIAKWTIERGKSTDATTQAMVDIQLKQLQGTLQALDKQLQSLIEIRAKTH